MVRLVVKLLLLVALVLCLRQCLPLDDAPPAFEPTVSGGTRG